MITIIVTLLLVGVGYYFYRKYRAELTADALIKDFTSVADKLETYAETKTKQAEAYAIQTTGILVLKERAETEVQKAKDYATKIKALFA